MDYDDYSGERHMTEERLALSMERIRSVRKDTGMDDTLHAFFMSAAEFLTGVFDLKEKLDSGTYRTLSLAEMQKLQSELYKDVLPEGYRESFLNPAAAVRKLGPEYGRVLSALYAEVRSVLRMVYEERYEDIPPVLELFLQIYGKFLRGETVNAAQAEDAVYWYAFDYLDVTVPERTRELLKADCENPEDQITFGFPLSDLRYLFLSGDYISEETLKTAEFMNLLPEETVQKAARTLTDGFKRGFEVAGKDIKKKKTVQIIYRRGFERLVLEEVRLFQEMGLAPVFPRTALRQSDKLLRAGAGCTSESPNLQFEYDHRCDSAIFFRKAYSDRRLTLLAGAYEELKNEAAVLAGPVLMEVFGEKPFEPENKPESYSYGKTQTEELNRHLIETMNLRERYLPNAEKSFSIISWPVPEIGKDFESIFADTVRINTLDSDYYTALQQKIIDVFDEAEFIEVKGKEKETTDLKISLIRLQDPASETKFENCVADVNIPAGEVFTTPVLSGTDGVLKVREVYVEGILFQNLYIRFRDGMAIDYGCANGKTEKEGKKLVREIILKEHDVLPMGEFAVGTNTLVSFTAEKYHIGHLLPILISEKAGPHFALGDTCYTREEDQVTRNPDGKKIAARDNEITIQRKEDPAKAYFGCHTDVPVPYGEIGFLSAVREDGSRTDIIRDGLFVLPGTEDLNQYLTDVEVKTHL
jgi:aminopeptidase